jgi:hypothetical protein
LGDDGKKYALKMIDYTDDDEKQSADQEETALRKVKGRNPYLLCCYDIYIKVLYQM